MWRAKPTENVSVAGNNTTNQTNKETNRSGTKTKADRTKSQNGLAGVDDHAEQKKRRKEK